MPSALEQFVKQLEDSGILAGDTIKEFIPPQASPQDVQELARELVRRKKLTKFQAEEIYRGKAKSLVLGNYVLLEKIGAGGMGQVFKARHRRMDRIVAVKLLPAKTMQDPATVARFEREVKAAARINHPNIVIAHDADQANGVHFLVMELVEGSDLAALVKKNGPLSVVTAVDYVLQAATGLQAAHKNGIVHRDIKPANLLLDSAGTVKILDLGLARFDGDENSPTQAALTGTGIVMGTVDYMAPEQALDSKTADTRADIYALGCTLYYFLTGKPLYSGETLMAKLLAHRDQPIPSLRETCPDVPEPVVAVFEKMVAKKVEDRYQSMTHVIAELQRYTGGSTANVTIQKSAIAAVKGNNSATLKNQPKTETIRPKVPHASAARRVGRGKNRKTTWIGAAVMGVAILMGIIIALRTRDGTLIVEIDQPDALVQVSDADGKVRISEKVGQGTVSISIDPGKHRLKVEKDGFAIFGQDFEIMAGSTTPIKAKLVPLEEEPAILGTKPPPVSGSAKPLFFQMPGFDPWVKEVAAMPAQQQVEAVAKKLVELNSGFDGKVTGWAETATPMIENGVVTEIGFITDHVNDISPVQALRGLTKLQCSGSDRGQGQLADLSPLRGLPLLRLNAAFNKVSDLSPIEGMRLNLLSCGGCPVSDLSLLSIKGMPLTELYCGGTDVTDLSPLRGMKLTTLQLSDTKVSDLSPLKGMALGVLWCDDTQVSDMSLLNEMPLKQIQFDFKLERDTELLGSIKTLERINDKPVAEFWKEQLANTPPAQVIDGNRHVWPADAPAPAIAPFDAVQAKQHQEEWATYLKVPVKYTNSIGMKFHLIPPGEFLMGSTGAQVERLLPQAPDPEFWPEHLKSSAPQHGVILTRPYYLGTFEVTQTQYERVMGQNPAFFSPTGGGQKTVAGQVTVHHPVESVTWYDAEKFCAKAGHLMAEALPRSNRVPPFDSTSIRLPTEAEWEFACRAGTTTRFWTGDDEEALKSAAWIGPDAHAGWAPHKVGTRRPNPFGLCDMHGNVYEWVQDRWLPDFYERFADKPAIDPLAMAATYQPHVARGGWIGAAWFAESSLRNVQANGSAPMYIGLRAVLSVDAVQAEMTSKSASPSAARPVQKP